MNASSMQSMSPSLQSILGPEALAAFEAPGPVARGLPGTAYTSEAFFALENERIFSASWVFAGFAHELARTGDVMPVTVAGRPVLLVRDAEHRIRAFHNVCRHRCLKLVDAPGNTGRTIRCPYHAWTYGLDGALHVTPYFGGREPRAAPDGFDRTEHGLVPIRSGTWHDWIFVNLNGAAPPLEDFIAPLRRRLDGIDLTRMHHLATIDFGEVGANWKLLLENFIEPYHVQFVHSTTTEQPLADHYTIIEPGVVEPEVVEPGGAESGRIESVGNAPGDIGPGGIGPGRNARGSADPGGIESAGNAPGGTNLGGIGSAGNAPRASGPGGVDPAGSARRASEPGCLGCAVDLSGDAKRQDTLSADSRFLTLFPNFVFGLYLPDQIGVHLDLPLAPGRTLQRRAIYGLGPEPASSERAEQLAKLWRDVHREDHAICERLQQGRASEVAAGGGVLSPVWEDSVRSFQELVVKRLR